MKEKKPNVVAFRVTDEQLKTLKDKAQAAKSKLAAFILGVLFP